MMLCDIVENLKVKEVQVQTRESNLWLVAYSAMALWHWLRLYGEITMVRNRHR